MSIDILGLGLRSAARSLQKGDFTSRELTAAVIDAVAERDGETGAFLSIDAEGALAQAEAADKARAAGEVSAISGLPIALKDNINVAGELCTCGSRMLEGFRAPFDSTVAARLRAAGAVLAGRANMDEFALGSGNESSAFKPALNPRAPGRVAGGSSGGSAAAVAGGMALAALGTDTGGSVRVPAAFCGCVGFKPGYGRVSRYGVAAVASSMDQVGTITKNVADAAVLLHAIAGRDPRDPLTSESETPDYAASLEGASLKGLRIAVPREFAGLQGLDAEMKNAMLAAAEACARAGAEVLEVDLPHNEYAAAVYTICVSGEAASNLARIDGVRYGKRAPGAGSVHDMYADSRAAGLGTEVKRRILLGTYLLGSDQYGKYYERALKARSLIARDYDSVFRSCDFLLTPATPTPAFLPGERAREPRPLCFDDSFCIGANLSGAAGISLPFGVTAAGLPISVQLLAPAMKEEGLLRAAFALEREVSA